MQTILKTFRLPKDCVDFLEKEAEALATSQSKIVIDSLKKKMRSDFEAQWKAALKIMAEDKEYQKEQVEMAEENYD